jgi:hypothetical protein
VDGYSTVCFSRLLVLTTSKLRLHFAPPSELQRNRSRFHWRNAQKQPTENTVAKKRVRWEDVDSDYLFGNCLHRPALRSTPCPRNPPPFSAELANSFGPCVFGGKSFKLGLAKTVSVTRVPGQPETARSHGTIGLPKVSSWQVRAQKVREIHIPRLVEVHSRNRLKVSVLLTTRLTASPDFDG